MAAQAPLSSTVSWICSNSCPWSRRCCLTISTSLPPSPLAFSRSQPGGSSHQVVKYWSFSFSVSTSSEYSGLISFRMDWLDLLAVQGTLKSLLQPEFTVGSVCLRFSAPFSPHTTAAFAWCSRGEWLTGTLMPSHCPFFLRALLLWDLPFL